MGCVRAFVRVYGKVQGVFYRYNTRKKALEYGVKGYVKNLPDGSVEAVLEGEENSVKMLLEWMKTGPPMARVDKIEFSFDECSGEYSDFIIKY